MMRKLKKLLSTSSKIRRNRQRLLNLQIQIFAWLVEFLGGMIFAIMVLGPTHGNIPNSVVGLFSSLIYFVIIPSVYSINNENFKSSIMENPLYLSLTNKLFSTRINKIFNENDDE